MQKTLRELVQHSIDRYRSEQETVVQTGVTTPTLLPTAPIQTPPLPSTPPLVPHSIPSVSPVLAHLGSTAATGVNGQQQLQHLHHPEGHANGIRGPLFAMTLLQSMPPAIRAYATNPLFHEALCYSQAAVFACSSATRAFSPSVYALAPVSSGVNRQATGVARVRRPDLSTLSLTTERLTAALEWVQTREGGGLICPREIGVVAECGMRDIYERIEDAIQVCQWNDLLNGVFLHGERSEEVCGRVGYLEAVMRLTMFFNSASRGSRRMLR
ncbi:hypothetical protein M408DRAFT_271591 [Serendipita vermifera MAFF 305830]|uniref:Uncharacterized protein n=1 Tax=Serendipita vermifera MAFF 305830 TaxID=933852 RepID=A0A0C3BFC8_SERVB|nr:hypothetical protein M408DRAFT_271591 [Serendipita vermifera MAFF 305830]